jgi:hypothetical protein
MFLLDKIAHMREELLTIERALERMQKQSVSLTERRDRPPETPLETAIPQQHRTTS